MSEQDPITRLIAQTARKVLSDVQQRCSDALKALGRNDYLVVIGALAGLEDQTRYVSLRLMVLREIKETQKQTRLERRKKHGP